MTWRGDEEQLYRDLAPVLTKRLNGMLRTRDDALVEEACSRAWEIFARRQAAGHGAERETLLSWLTTVAKHEAYRLIREPTHEQLDTAARLAGRNDPVAAWLELYEALATVRELSPRMQEIVADRVRGLTYEEIAQARGRSYTNVARWVTRTRERLVQLRSECDSDDRGRPRALPPMHRIDQLERQPPPYLRDTLGPPPRADSKRGGYTARLAWRRGALLIERYRHDHQIADRLQPLGAEPQDPEAQRVYRATLAAIGRAQAQIKTSPERGLSR
jgi:RNA polymerase sigma factor (sigma-70 family)